MASFFARSSKETVAIRYTHHLPASWPPADCRSWRLFRCLWAYPGKRPGRQFKGNEPASLMASRRLSSGTELSFWTMRTLCSSSGMGWDLIKFYGFITVLICVFRIILKRYTSDVTIVLPVTSYVQQNREAPEQEKHLCIPVRAAILIIITEA